MSIWSGKLLRAGMRQSKIVESLGKTNETLLKIKRKPICQTTTKTKDMKTFKIIFNDAEGNELFTKTNEFFDLSDATKYANNILGESRDGAESFEIYEQ